MKVYDTVGNRLAMELAAEHDQALPFDEYAPTLDEEPEMKHPMRVEYV